MAEITHRVALVSGATGVVGHRLAAHLAERADWQVIGLSRRAPRTRIPGVTYIAVDIAHAESIAGALATIGGVSHIFHAARYDHSTEQPEPVDVNSAMLGNLLDWTARTGQPLRHVHLVQGSKYYGSNIGPYRTPAREGDPRSLQDNFYFAQEDACIERGQREGWTWSASRPHAICDDMAPLARSLPSVIGVYAAISKALGQPLFFPGTAGNFNAVYQCTDASHLAAAVTWMADNPRCGNEAFNVTNGDFIRWTNLWPRFATYFGMDFGGVRSVPLARVMADKAAIWDRIVAEHELRKTRYDEVALWSYADFIFTPHWDMMSDTSKARRFGFEQA